MNRSAIESDAADLARIYNHYIANTCVTFETEAVTPGEMAQRVEEAHSVPLPWLVAEDSGGVIGYAYASTWKGRCAYRYSVESTIYLDPHYTGKSIGSNLYAALLDAIRDNSLHSVIAGIALPNDPSIKLHERLGFERIGEFKQVGYKQDRWVDVGYWQLLI